MFLSDKLWLFYDIYANIQMFHEYKHLKFRLKRMPSGSKIKLSESMKHSVENTKEKANNNLLCRDP